MMSDQEGITVISNINVMFKDNGLYTVEFQSLFK